MGEDWIARWRDGRTGWHEPSGNAALQRHWRAIERRVLVPLCGASPDLVWLAAQGNDVTGVELSPLAARRFFDEQGLGFSRQDGAWPVFACESLPLRIAVCDFFDFDDEPFDAIYDRASLIALPAEDRPGYVKKLRSLTAAGAYHLLVTLEYEQSLAKGPPFAVGSDEVLSYWPALERLDARSELGQGPPKFSGLPRLDEVVWRDEGRVR